MNVAGLVCVVAGGASGIGLATVRQPAGQGPTVVVLSPCTAQCDRLRAEDVAKGWDLDVATGDVGDLSAWVVVGERLRQRGGVDVLVNNAGIGLQGDVLETDPGWWDDLMRANVTDVFLGSRAVLPSMVDAGCGSIVNVASVAGQMGMSRRAAYCASKAAVMGLTRAMAVDHARSGARVNAAAPGTTDTPYFAKTRPRIDDPASYRRHLADRQLLQRLAEPDEIVQAIVSAASPASSSMTASVITVDGGMSIS
jgi:NAD(P)-dependent dehydrogenase (short-subunit alcohol dehydrogenase family)